MIDNARYANTYAHHVQHTPSRYLNARLRVSVHTHAFLTYNSALAWSNMHTCIYIYIRAYKFTCICAIPYMKQCRVPCHSCAPDDDESKNPGGRPDWSCPESDAMCMHVRIHIHTHVYSYGLFNTWVDNE